MLNVSTKIKQAASTATAFILTISLLCATLTVVGPQKVAAQTKDLKPVGTPINAPTTCEPLDPTCGPWGGGDPSPTPSPTPKCDLVDPNCDPNPDDPIPIPTPTPEPTPGPSPCLEIAFTPPMNFPVGGAPFAVTTGDFNKDGKLDLASANHYSDNVSVLLGDGSGGFAAAANFGAGDGPRSVATGDFNADGNLDLAVGNNLSDNVSVLLGDGAGAFAAAANFGAGDGPRSVATGDFNADGNLDLAVANSFSSNVSVLLGDGSGGFAAAANFGTGGLPRSVATGDFNADGNLDLSAATEGSGSADVSVLLGSGAGGFTASVNFAAGGATFSITTGDFNSDGKLDLAAANSATDDVSVLIGNGAGGFAPAVSFLTGNRPRSVISGDFDADGNLDLATANTDSNNVSILLGNGAGAFAPAANFPVGYGPYSVAVGDFDGDGRLDLAAANNGSDTISVLLNTCGANTAPVADGNSYSIDEDTGLNVPAAGVLANDTDGDGDPLTAALVTGPSNGTLTLNQDGSFGYTPDPNFSGPDSFTYKAGDGSADSNVATVTITINPVNDAPVANGGSITTDEDTPSSAFTLTGSDDDNDSLTFEIVTAPVKGTYDAATGIYTPNLNANGSDSFTFIAKDSVSQSSAVTVSITINPVNDAPIANAQSVTTDEDAAEAITLSGSDPDDANTPLTYSVVGQPAHGALSGTGANLTYTPAANFSGTDSFTFRVSDGVLDSDTATVNITITAVNDAPVANDDSRSTDEDTALSGNVLSNDTDVDGDPMTVDLVTGPTNALSFTLNAKGNFTYTPDLNFYGPDSFTYNASDGSADSNVATVTITVNAVNDAPVVSVTPASQSVQYSDPIAAVTFTASDVDSTISTSTQFNVDGGLFSPGLPNGLKLGAFTSGAATLSGVADVAAGVYIIRFTASDTSLSSSVDHTLTVTKEHTETEFTGDLYALTAGPTVDTANVRLAAQLTQEADGQPGDITKANVSFLLFNANNLGSTPDLTVSGVPVDGSGAALTFVNLPVDAWTVKVKIDADNGYWKANPVGMGTITIEQPTTELRTSGGGWVADVESENGRGNFGFNVANHKKGVKGSSIYLFRGLDGFNYLVKSTSWNSGGIAFRKEGSVISLASFSGKCVVQKIDPGTGDVADSFGNYSFTVDVRDGDLFDPRQSDKYAITILNSDELVWRQVGSRTSPLIIGGGNVTVKGK